jgi:hypothetical protein
MNKNELNDKVKKYISNAGFGTGTNITLHGLKCMIIDFYLDNQEKTLSVNSITERFSDNVIDKLALDKYPESFCWYGSNPPRNIDDNARSRRFWKKGFKAALNAL